MRYIKKVLFFLNTGIIINNSTLANMLVKENLSNSKQLTNFIKKAGQGLEKWKQTLLCYDYDELGLNTSDFDYDNEEFGSWINKKAKKQLLNDINKHEQEVSEKLLGYQIEELLNGLSKPKTKVELENYLRSGFSYKQWLLVNAKETHATNIFISKENAKNRARLLGYELTELIIQEDIEVPKNKQELENYNRNGISYEDWLVTTYERLANNKLNDEIKISIITAKNNANLILYKPEALFPDSMIEKPKNKAELINYQNYQTSFSDALKQIYQNLKLEKTNEILVDIKDFNKNEQFYGYTIADLLAAPIELTTFKSGNLTRATLKTRAKQKFLTAIKTIAKAAIVTANKLGYTIFDLDTSNLPSAPLSKSDFSNYQNSGTSYKEKLIAFYEAAALAKRNNETDHLTQELTSDEIKMLLGYKLSNLLITKDDIERYRSGKLTKSSLFAKFTTKLASAIEMARQNAVSKANLRGYNLSELIINPKIGIPTTKTTLVNFDNQGNSYEKILIDLYETAAARKLNSDFLSMIKSIKNNIDFLNYNKNEFGLSHYQIPEIKQALAVYEKSLIELYQKDICKRWSIDFAELNLTPIEKNKKILGYSLQEILKTKDDIEIYKERKNINEVWLLTKAQLKLASAIEMARQNAVSKANLRGYNLSELIINPKIGIPTTKTTLVNFDNQGNSYEKILINLYETAATNKLIIEIEKLLENIKNRIDFRQYNEYDFGPNESELPQTRQELANYVIKLINIVQQKVYYKLKLDLQDLELSSSEENERFLGYGIKEILRTKNDINRYKSNSLQSQNWLLARAQTKLNEDIKIIQKNAATKANLRGYELSNLATIAMTLPNTKVQLTNFDSEGNSYEAKLIEQYEISSYQKLLTDVKELGFLLPTQTHVGFKEYIIIELLTNKNDIDEYQKNKPINPNWLEEKATKTLLSTIKSIIESAWTDNRCNILGYDFEDLTILLPQPKDKPNLTNYNNTRLSYKDNLIDHINLIAKRKLENEIKTIKMDDLENNVQLLGYKFLNLITNKSELTDLKNFGKWYEDDLVSKAKTKLEQEINFAESLATNSRFTEGYNINDLELSLFEKPKNKSELENYQQDKSYLNVLLADCKRAVQKKLNEDIKSSETRAFATTNMLGYNANILSFDDTYLSSMPASKWELDNYKQSSLSFEQWLKANWELAAQQKLNEEIEQLVPHINNIKPNLLGYNIKDLFSNSFDIINYQNTKTPKIWLETAATAKLNKAINQSIESALRSANKLGYDNATFNVVTNYQLPTTKTRLDNYNYIGVNFEKCLINNIEKQAQEFLFNSIQKEQQTARKRANLFGYTLDDLKWQIWEIDKNRPQRKEQLKNFHGQSYNTWLIEKYEAIAKAKLKNDIIIQQELAIAKANLLNFDNYSLIRKFDEQPTIKAEFDNYKGSNKSYQSFIINLLENTAKNHLKMLIDINKYEAKQEADLLGYDFNDLIIPVIPEPTDYNKIIYYTKSKSYKGQLLHFYQEAAKNKLYNDIKALQVPENWLANFLGYKLEDLFSFKTDIDNYKEYKNDAAKKARLMQKANYKLSQAIHDSIDYAKVNSNILGYRIDQLYTSLIKAENLPKNKQELENYHQCHKSYQNCLIEEIEKAAISKLDFDIKAIEKRVLATINLYGYDIEDLMITEKPKNKIAINNYHNFETYEQWLVKTYNEKAKAKLAQEIASLDLILETEYLGYRIWELIKTKNDIDDLKNNLKNDNSNAWLIKKAKKVLAQETENIENLLVTHKMANTIRSVIATLMKPQTKFELYNNYRDGLSYQFYIIKKIQDPHFINKSVNIT